VREREKKGGGGEGAAPFYIEARQSESWGVRWGVAPRGGRKRGGGGPTAVVREWRSRVAAGRRYSIEQGSGGH
jgi:hypothetical protein